MTRFGVHDFSRALILSTLLSAAGMESAFARDALAPIQMLANTNVRKPSVFIPEADVKLQLQKQFQDEVVKPIFDDLYRGVIYPRGRDDMMSQRSYPEQEFGKPPINPPIPLPRNQCKDETRKNILEDPSMSECGKMAYVGFISQTTSPKTFLRSPNRMVLVNLRFWRGSFLAAVSQVELEIVAEIKNNRITHGELSCERPAQDLLEVLDQTHKLPNIDKIADCRLPQNTTEGRCSAFRYVDAIEKQTRNMLMNFLRCRLVAKSSSLYRAFTFNAMEQIRSNALAPCESACEEAADSNGCLKTCYETKFRSWIKSKAEAAFPDVYSTCQGVR